MADHSFPVGSGTMTNGQGSADHKLGTEHAQALSETQGGGRRVKKADTGGLVSARGSSTLLITETCQSREEAESERLLLY